MSGYSCLRADVVHPEYGSYRVDIHGVHSPDDGLVLMAFFGVPAQEQLDTVSAAALHFGGSVVQLPDDAISMELAARLAAHFHAHPTSGITVVQVHNEEES